MSRHILSLKFSNDIKKSILKGFLDSGLKVFKTLEIEDIKVRLGTEYSPFSNSGLHVSSWQNHNYQNQSYHFIFLETKKGSDVHSLFV